MLATILTSPTRMHHLVPTREMGKQIREVVPPHCSLSSLGGARPSENYCPPEQKYLSDIEWLDGSHNVQVVDVGFFWSPDFLISPKFPP